MPATVLQLSDTHLPRSPGDRVYDRDPDERLARVLAAWEATGEETHLVLLTGDLADAGHTSACERLASAVAPIGAPVLALPGNHDLPEAVASTWGGDDEATVAGWRVVAVDTTIPGEVHGAVDVASVLHRLDADRRPTVLALHHPPLSRSTDPQFRLEGSAALLDGLAARPHVRAVVAGHLHDAVELHGPRDDLPVLLAPSTLMGITHRGAEMTIDPTAPTGARVLHLADDGTLSSRVLQA